MNELEPWLRTALALPPADPNFKARVRARMAAHAWRDLDAHRTAPDDSPRWLKALNLLAACFALGLLCHGLVSALPGEAWWWLGLVAGSATACWSLGSRWIPNRR